MGGWMGLPFVCRIEGGTIDVALPDRSLNDVVWEVGLGGSITAINE